MIQGNQKGYCKGPGVRGGAGKRETRSMTDFSLLINKLAESVIKS